MSQQKLRAGDVQVYRACDFLSGPVIYFFWLFGPWAFGTTQPWSIWTMNTAGFVLGLLLLPKLVIRWFRGYRPPRWESRATAMAEGPSTRIIRRLTVALAVLTVLVITWCFVSALNARATWHPTLLRFDYHGCLSWLPNSLDSSKSWSAFWMYLGMACAFWGLRDWLLGLSDVEARCASAAAARLDAVEVSQSGFLLPERLRRLLWLLAINGGFLAVEGIFQRLEGSGKLLFLLKPRVNPGAVAQFGPWAYRANAAQYFNLLWPVCVGFWWTLQRSPGAPGRGRHVLLVCASLMAACPIISSSRGGAMVTVGLLVLVLILLFAMHFFLRSRRASDRRHALAELAIFFLSALALGLGMGWKNLAPRMEEVPEGFAGREQMSALARPMAEDYPWFGTGPGTFETVFQLYRPALDTYWPAQLHNDWLETRITFGLLGSGLLILALGIVLARWFLPGGVHGGRRFVLLIWLAIAGCLVHARFDLPFQIHSIAALFLALCAILSVVSRE